MAFEETQFPPGISYGSSGGPGYRSSIIALDSGQEQRVSYWEQPRRTYNAAYNIKSKADLAALLEFYTALDGVATGFRYKDWLDFTTASNHQSSPANTDVTLGTGDASTTAFQLKKVYTAGTATKTRNIRKPVSGTVVVALDGAAQTSGWTVDTTTGIITFTSAPGSGVEVTAGCEFDVPVRFGDGVDSLLDASIESFDNGGMEVPLIEILDEASIPKEFNTLGANEFVLTANKTLNLAEGLLQVYDATSASLSISAPDPTAYEIGGPYWTIVLVTGSESVALKDEGGTTLVTLTATNSVTFYLTENSSSNKEWVVIG